MQENIVVHIMVALRNFVLFKEQSQLDEALQELAVQSNIHYEELITVYNRLFLFQQALENVGGEQAYLQSDIVWLKEELELLLECYTFFQQKGVSVVTISECLSKDQLNIFPKTKSQLQNTYYKLRNEKMEIANTFKQKPGRKPGHDLKKETVMKKADKKVKQEPVRKSSRPVAAMTEQHIEQQELRPPQPKKNLVQLLSGMVNNFQVICEHNAESEQQIYQLMEGIYELSNMAAERTTMKEDQHVMKTELSILRRETERLQLEKEELIGDIRSITSNLNDFVESSDVEQIRGLSQFVTTCKAELNKLGLDYGVNERKLKVLVDRSGQVVSVTD
ncbi:DNA-binding domain-containing protein [Microbacteriaceae bacterium 4G12]